MEYIIYKITNSRNGKCYVGFTSKTISSRWRKHQVDAQQGRDTYLCNAIRKYGSSAFKIEILDKSQLLSEARDRLEPMYIRRSGSHYSDGGYNMTYGGEGTMGHKHSEETKRKMSESSKGMKHSEETKQKLSQQRLGAGNPNYGRNFSLEHRARIGAAGKGSKNPRAKSYNVITPEGKAFTINDRKGFCEENKLNYWSVCDAIRRNKPYKGY